MNSSGVVESGGGRMQHSELMYPSLIGPGGDAPASPKGTPIRLIGKGNRDREGTVTSNGHDQEAKAKFLDSGMRGLST